MDSKLTEGLFDLMTDMSDTHPLLRAMLYGDSGVGKTVLAAQIAHKLGGRWLYVDYAQGFTTLTINPRWKYLTENMKRMQYQGMSQFEPLRDAINSDDPRFQFNGIILDESSSMADQNLLTVVKGRASKEPTKDENEPKQPDMMASTNICKKAFDALNSTKCHVIHITHVRKDKDNLNIEVTSPKFMPALSGAVREPMQLVGYVAADLKPNMANEEYVRYVQVSPSRTVVAKTRIDGLGVKISFDKLVDAVGAFARGERELVDSSTFVPESIEPSAEIPVY